MNNQFNATAGENPRRLPLHKCGLLLGGTPKRKSVHANLKYKYGSRSFWCRGYYVDTVGRNKKVIAEYIRNQLEEDYARDQITMKEYIDSSPYVAVSADAEHCLRNELLISADGNAVKCDLYGVCVTARACNFGGHVGRV